MKCSVHSFQLLFSLQLAPSSDLIYVEIVREKRVALRPFQGQHVYHFLLERRFREGLKLQLASVSSFSRNSRNDGSVEAVGASWSQF